MLSHWQIADAKLARNVSVRITFLRISKLSQLLKNCYDSHMFDRACTATQLAAAEKHVGFTLVPQTHETCDQWIEHLKDAVDAKGKPVRKLVDDEIRFIENERAICTWDFLYFATRYTKVKNEAGEMVKFEPRLAQMILIDILGEDEAKMIAIYLLILKARQGGISTFFLIIQVYFYNFFTGRAGVLASSTPGKTAKFCNRMREVWLSVPWWLRPEGIQTDGDFYAVNDNKIGTFVDLQSMNNLIVAAAGNQKTSTARGETWQLAHVSELDEWDDPKADIEAALLNAMHPHFMNMVIVEGTGGHPEGWWPETYRTSKEKYPTGRSRYRPLFLPWYLFREIHPTEAWLRAFPVPKNWKPKEPTVNQALRASEFVASNEYLNKYLGKNWVMPLEQQWWWEFHYEEAERGETLHTFMVEQAADDVSCWQRDNLSAFSERLIMKVQLKSREPKAVYAITEKSGMIIPQRLLPDKDQLWIDPNDPDGKRTEEIEVVAHWVQSADPITFVLKRLKWKGGSATSPNGNKLLVWHYPEEGEHYAIGGDACNGVGKDRAVIEVLKIGNYEHIDQQAAELADPWLLAEDLAVFHLAVGTWYAGPKKVQPIICQETKTSGDVIIRRLFQWGWWHFRVDENYQSQPGASELLRFGLDMNMRTRPSVLGAFHKGIADDELEVNSIWVGEEMRDMSPTESTITLAKAIKENYHDDRVMGLGMARFIAHIDESYYDIQKARKEREALIVAESEVVDYNTHWKGQTGGFYGQTKR